MNAGISVPRWAAASLKMYLSSSEGIILCSNQRALVYIYIYIRMSHVTCIAPMGYLDSQTRIYPPGQLCIGLLP
jgi:hypothetical protein